MGVLLSKYRETDKNNWSKTACLSLLAITGLVSVLLFFKASAIQKAASEIEDIFALAGILDAAKQFAAYFNILRVLAAAGLIFLTADFLAYKEEQRWFSKLAGLSAMTTSFLAVIGYWKLGSAFNKLSSFESLLNMDFETEAMIFDSNYTFANILLAVSFLSAAAGTVFWVLSFTQKKIYAIGGVSSALSYQKDTESQNAEAASADNTSDENNDGINSQTQQVSVIQPAEKEPKEPFDWKKYKVHAMAAGGILTAVAAFFVWNTFFNFTEVDVFDHIEVRYYGVDGRGTVSIQELRDVLSEVKILEFLDTVKYSADKNSKLSDGDTIILSAEYDKELMKKNKIKVKAFQKEYTVKGLDIIPKTVSEIEGYEDIQTELRNRAKVLCEEDYKNNSYSYRDITSYKLSEETFFYGDSEEDGAHDAYNRERTYYYGTLAVVYKVTYSYRLIFSETRTETEYVMYTYTGIIKNGETGVFEKGKYSPKLLRIYRAALPAVEIDLEHNYKLKKVN